MRSMNDDKSAKETKATRHLNQISCPQCGKLIDDRAPACPRCGRQNYVEHPADITPTKHPPLDLP